MENPCKRECPNRTPGCNCEKRQAWKWIQEERKKAKRKDRIVTDYTRSTARRLLKRQNLK